jgi:hypothetical protein
MADYLKKPLADPALTALVALQPAVIDKFKPVNVELTTTGTSTVWTPTTGTSFVVYGWDIHILTTVTLAAAVGGVALCLYDASVSDANIIGTLETLRSDASAGQMFHSQLDRRFGHASASVNQALIVGPAIDITTGKVRISGTVWGTEV